MRSVQEIFHGGHCEQKFLVWISFLLLLTFYCSLNSFPVHLREFICYPAKLSTKLPKKIIRTSGRNQTFMNKIDHAAVKKYFIHESWLESLNCDQILQLSTLGKQVSTPARHIYFNIDWIILIKTESCLIFKTCLFGCDLCKLYMNARKVV